MHLKDPLLCCRNSQNFTNFKLDLHGQYVEPAITAAKLHISQAESCVRNTNCKTFPS